MINCPHCGTPVPSNFKFCGACGGPIAAAAPPAAAAEPAAPPPSSLDDENTQGIMGTLNRAQGFEDTAQVPTTGLDTASSPSTGNAVAKLVVIRPDGTEGATIPVHEGELIIGRESEHEALSGDPFLSPRHASITISGSSFTIKDLESLNGVFYRIRVESELQDDDYIRIGQELLRFNFVEEASGTSEDETRRGGSPDSGTWGKLSLIAGPEVVSRAFAFADDEITMGRERGDILFRDDGFVSGLHARISKADGKGLLKDLGSSNGTYIKVRGERTLEDGDLILMGQQLFRLVA
jgi:pSer/pThr/pTyr-binding forkhead associated (FHA) protein